MPRRDSAGPPQQATLMIFIPDSIFLGTTDCSSRGAPYVTWFVSLQPDICADLVVELAQMTSLPTPRSRHIVKSDMKLGSIVSRLVRLVMGDSSPRYEKVIWFNRKPSSPQAELHLKEESSSHLGHRSAPVSAGASGLELMSNLAQPHRDLLLSLQHLNAVIL